MSIPITSGLVEKLPETVWLQHKATLHRLYIVENKTLNLVKQTMEGEHDFPAQRLCDYEVALRDILHFRKNLKREDWRAIATQVSDRKRRGKKSEIIWNKTRFEAKKVRKELHRYSQSKSRLTRNVNPELPHGLLIRTPPRSPVTCAAVVTASPEGQLGNFLVGSAHAVSGGSNHPINAYSVADETIWDVQRALVDAGEFTISPYRKLRENLPFNRYMSQLLDLAQSRPRHFRMPTAETWAPAFPRLFGVNPSWEFFGQRVFQLSNKQHPSFEEPVENRKWFLTWIGLSADFALLRAFFSINSPTAGAVYECLRDDASRFRMSHLLRVLFELRHVLSHNNSSSFNEGEFIDAAVLIGSRSGDNLNIVNTCLGNKPSLPSTRKHGPWGLTSNFIMRAASRCDIAILRVLVDAGLKVDPRLEELTEGVKINLGQIMNHIYNWDSQDQSSLSEYIELLHRGGVLDGNASLQRIDDDRFQSITGTRPNCPITCDELLMICQPMMRRALHMAITPCLGDQGTRICTAGVFMIAQDGATHLRTYLEAHREDDPFLTRMTLEECLMCAAILNDLNTAAVLLEVGVDPHIGLLSKNLEGDQKGKLPWNPSAVAAAAGNLEVLTLLLGHINLSSFLDVALIHQLVHNETFLEDNMQGWMKRRLCRLSDLRRYYLQAQRRSSRLAVEGETYELMIPQNGGGRTFETLDYIRSIAHSQDLGLRVDHEIIKAAVSYQPCYFWDPKRPQRLPYDALLMKGLVDGNLEYEEDGMDLLHLSIRNHCSFPVVSLLSARGLGVHSRPGGLEGNSMLHDALLSLSPDRSKIVEFLLEEGADCKVCGEGLTILEASLCDGRGDLDDRSECLRIFERLLNSGAPVHHWPRKHLKVWQPLVCLLLDIEARDDLILRVIDAGAPLNACGYGSEDPFCNLTPLQAALFHRRERLARELIRRGADVHAPASPLYGQTALQVACYSSLPIQFLEHLVVVLGVNVNEPSAKKEGVTSLAAAVHTGSLNTVEFLLEHGADVNATYRVSRGTFLVYHHPRARPLDLAVLMGSLDMVELLLKAGGRSREAGLGGAIRIAAKEGHFAILSVLRSWDEKYGSRILQEEALWQRQNPEQALMLSESSNDSDDSGTDDSEDGC